MNKSFRSTVTIVALLAAAVGLKAQGVGSIATVDMQRLYDNYYKTEDFNTSAHAEEKKAKDSLDVLGKQRETLYAEAKDLQEQAKNPLSTDDARKAKEAELQKKAEAIQKLESDMQNLLQTAQRVLQSKAQNFQQTAVEEIGKRAAEVAKRKGATIVINRSLNTVVLYSDPSLDVTEEVLVAINKDRPTPALTVPAPAAK